LQNPQRRSNVKKFLIFGLLLFGLIFVVSCATAPKKEPVPAKGEVVPPPESEYGQAKELRSRIEKWGLDRYAAEEFSAAEGRFNEGESAYNKDNAKAKTAFKDAIKGYQAVIDKGFPAYLDEKIAEVESLKKSAEEIKAPVALKNDYNGAKAVYAEALNKKKKEQYEEASDLLDRAQTQFQSVYDVTLAKKYRAEKNIDEANEGINELESAAEQEQIE
jgi:hypothetical protein